MIPSASESKNELDTTQRNNRLRFLYRDVLLLLLLVALVVAVFWRLALTNLIVGRGDLFFYFYPYRDFASEAVREGRVPLWNPYSFMGAPFVANSQAGFFYPFNLVLAWLPVQQMVNASIVLHAALAAIGAFLWGRHGLGLGRPGAWLAGLSYGLGGYFVAQVEHLNQVQVLAWLPWLLWLYTLRFSKQGTAARTSVQVVFRIAGLALVVALQFLAGHTQSIFICLVGLAGYALLPLLWEVVRRRAVWRELLCPLVVVLGASLLGAALAAIQLLPTLELSRLSVRSGGLPYKEAVSFSLRPELVGRALLPSWGPPLFPEYIAYVGVVGLGLAGLGILADWWGARVAGSVTWEDTLHVPCARRRYLARRGALVLAALGLFLALGGFNPLYVVLVKLVPGFGLFRAPARWLALYAVGVAGLVGIGLDAAITMVNTAPAWTHRRWRALWMAGVGSALLLAGWALLGGLVRGDQTADVAPALGIWSVLGWSVAALGFGAVLFLGFRSRALLSPRFVTLLLILLAAIELLGASVFLPINRATAPEALTSLRPAVAHLLGEAKESVPGPPDRFLSISDIYFDPGDKPEIEIILGSQVSADALYDYIIATKQKEVLIPNLPLYYRLPAMDGYDGGVLPLRRYVTLERLYMPEERVAIDGRLRENLGAVPDGRWLSLFNVRHVVTDKVGDAWFDDVFYDLQMGAILNDGDEASVGYVPSLSATALGIVYQADGAAEGALLAQLDVTFSDGRQMSLPLLADGSGEGDRVARLTWAQPDLPTAVQVRGVREAGPVTIRGLSLIDERTGAFLPLILSDSGRYRLVHSGDVKIYENLETLPRLVFIPQAITAPDDEATLAIMRAPDFSPYDTVVLQESQSQDVPPEAHHPEPRVADHATTQILRYEPEFVSAAVNTPTDGWLLLTDAWYPGWEATVDGERVPVERADILFRAIPVPAGEHSIEWTYQPGSFRLGLAISLCTLGLLAAGIAWLVFKWRIGS